MAERRVSQRERATISPRRFGLVIFDLDGVLTRTARVHAAAWKTMFDAYLDRRGAREGRRYEPFQLETDYRRYVDGKPRYDGVKSFLESRGLSLPYGSPEDPPDRDTICGLGNRKNQLFLSHLVTDRVEVYDSTIALVEALRKRGVKTAVVSSSKNCKAVLHGARIEQLFDIRVDGTDLARLGLPGKPAPDLFLEAARRLCVPPERAVVVEDALSGVEAGRRGGFGLVVGVDRAGQAPELRQAGADVVVLDLAEVAAGEERAACWSCTDVLPGAIEHAESIRRRAAGKRLALFLDYDGTLTPIVSRPEQATLGPEMREAVRAVARRHPVAVVSGRGLADVRRLVGLDEIVYAGSHGFEIVGPHGREMGFRQGAEFLPVLEQAGRELQVGLDRVPGAWVERKPFSIAVHYRQAAEDAVRDIDAIVDGVRARHPELRKAGGKKIFELQPDIEWDKGRAVLWLLSALGLEGPDVLPLYIGDDLTDEDAFVALADRGIGIVVREEAPRPTAAGFALDGPEGVRRFLAALAAEAGGAA